MDRCYYSAKTLVDVAQLVEPRIVIPAVVGSNPIVHPTLYPGCRVRALGR